MDKRFKQILLILTISVTIGLFFIAGIASRIPVVSFVVEKMHRMDLVIYDCFMNARPPFEPSEKILLVSIDNKSEEKLGAFPWDREVHARLINQLNTHAPSVIAFDVFFGGKTETESDRKLAEAADKAGNVISVCFLKINQQGKAEMIYPYPKLRENLAGMGSPAVYPDSDDVVRKVQVHNRRFPIQEPFFLSILKQYFGLKSNILRFSPGNRHLLLGARKVPLEHDYNMLINYPGKHFKRISYVDALEGNYEDEDVRGKIIIVVSMNDPRDQFKTPRKVDGKPGNLFGGEIHASAVQTVLENRYIYHLSDLKIWLVGCLLCAIGVGFLFKLDHLKAIPVFIVEVIAYYFICRYIFISKNLWVNPVIPSTMLFLCWIGVFVLESQRVKDIFSQFLPKKAVEKMLTSSEESALGGKTTRATVLFSDIRGFTTLSEHHSPQEILNLLNRYHNKLSRIVEENRGSIFDYAGDGTLIVFGVPDKLENHEQWAVRAAVKIQEHLHNLNKNISEADMPLLSVGIGICTGEVAYGNIGEESHKKYTVIGDVVNTASRLQGLSQKLKSNIIIDENTKSQLGQDFRIKDLGKVSVKGKADKIQVYGISKASSE